MKSPEQTQEQAPKRSLVTNPAETIEAMAQIEGPNWLQAQIVAQEGRANVSERAISVQQAFDNLAKGKRTVIYGAGGENRWLVAPDGSVSFSEKHARSPEHIEKARELGFTIVL